VLLYTILKVPTDRQAVYLRTLGLGLAIAAHCGPAT
jgi:hypothetical protein